MHVVAVTFATHSQFSDVLERLAQRHAVTLLAPDPAALPYPVVTYTPEVSRHGPRPQRTRASLVGTGRSVGAAIRGLQGAPPDVIFGQASFGCTLGLQAPSDVPVVSHVELPGLEMEFARPEWPPSAEAVAADRTRRSLVYRALRDSALVVTPTAYSRGRLPNDIQGKTRVCMEGFTAAERALSAPERRALRRRLGLADGAVVGFFGRTLEAVRGFDVFCRAAKHIRAIDPDVTILAVGADHSIYGKERAALGELTFKQYSLRAAGLGPGDVVIRDFQNRSTYTALMAASDVAVFPLFEGAGVWSVFESLAVGTPVVASARCFLPEVVTEGVNGFLCEPSDHTAFAERCLELLRCGPLRARAGEAAIATIRERYSPPAAARCYEAVLTEATNMTLTRPDEGP